MHLELLWRDRRAGTMQTPRRFLDFVVDGEALYERHGSDFIGCLGWLRPESDDAAARRLLRKEKPDIAGRVSLYICPEDADPHCGVISTFIEREGNDLVWRDMAMSRFDFQAGRWVDDPTGLEAWRLLRFPAAEYWRAITERPLPLCKLASRDRSDLERHQT
jgi:hypothetical protein